MLEGLRRQVIQRSEAFAPEREQGTLLALVKAMMQRH
jgi:hypothetical protein